MITKVYLLSVPLDKDYKNTFYFGSATDQKSYFNSKIKHSFTDFTYQRKDNTIRIPLDYDTAIKCNYVMYQNTNESSKWFYAFITDYQWSDEDTTTLTIQTDVLQTYAFDYTVLTSFVEREHVADDTIGLHTLPENIETGEFKCIQYDTDAELIDTHIVLGTTVDSMGENVQGGNYNGIYSGVKYYSYDSETGTGFVNSFIQILTNGTEINDFKGGKIDALQCIFLAPKFLTTDDEGTLGVAHSNTMKTYQKTITEKQPTIPVKNNKCLTFPYRHILVSNNNGGSAVYKYESFAEGLNFSIQGALTPGCSVRLVPKKYKGVELNNEEGLNLGKYPICNWNSDVFTNWLTQNSVNIGLNIASGVAQIVGGVGVALASGGVGVAVGGSSVVGGVSAITTQLAQIHQMSFTPPQSHGNINCGDVITASDTNTYHFYQMSIKDEYLKIIDEYFDMFGYKCNRVKIPEKNHREHWWYTKTIDVNITGDIPQNDLETIKNCYNAGITFWKDDIKNYARTNAII